MGFGERLQREREMRRITLDEIATATKIGTRSLRALEEEDFKKLPGGIFNKGFVRAYARYLGIDEEQAVADYMAAIGEPSAKDAPLDQERLKTIEANWKPPQREETGDPGPIRLPWGLLAIVLIIAGAAAGTWHYRHAMAEKLQQLKDRRHPKVEQATTLQQGSTPALPQAEPVSSQMPAAAPAPAEPSSTAADVNAAATQPGSVTAAPAELTGQAAEGFVLQVRAHQDTWVEIFADGKHGPKGTIKAGREQEIRARDRITLKTGNAAGLELSFNGRPLPPLGAAKEVRTVTFTAQGLQSSDGIPQ